MQAERLITGQLNALRVRARRRSPASLPLCLALALCCAGAAQAQSSASPGSPSNGGQGGAPVTTTAPVTIIAAPATPAPVTSQVRSRRVAETPTARAADEAAAPAAQPSASGTDRLSALRAQIEDARTDDERIRLQRTLVDYLVALNKKSEAVGELRAMSRAERIDPVGFYNLGNALARLGETDAAIEVYRKAINQRHGNYSRALNNLGVLLLRQGRWDEAQEALTTALRLESFRYGEASYNLGRLYSMRGEADLAIREWSRTLAIQPDHADAAIALARAYAEDGSPERGLAVLDTFMTRRGANAEVSAARRELLYGESASPAAGSAAQTNTNARASVTAVSTAQPASPASPAPASPVNSGKAPLNRTKGGSRASSALRTLAVDRESYDLLQRARQAREEGRYQDAVGEYRRVLSRRGGFFPPANLELSYALASLKRYDEAVASLLALTSKEGERYPIA
ncbi:MAG TPA: tetratricopeptide repeat protein, partial [Pyrinomonadaceae bacterium]